MIAIGPAQQAMDALPSVSPRPSGVPASTTAADFASLLRAAGQVCTPVSSSGSVRQAQWLAQSSRRPDIEAALAQRHMERRVPSPSPGAAGGSPPGTPANLPEPMERNTAEGFLRKGTEEIARACVQARGWDRCDEKHQDPWARQDDACGLDLVHGVPVACGPAVAAPPAAWPSSWVAWPFYPPFQHPLQALRVRIWRRRAFYACVDELADESGGDGQRERG